MKCIVRDLHEVGQGWTIVEQPEKTKLVEYFWKCECNNDGLDPVYYLLEGLSKALNLKVTTLGCDGESCVYEVERL